MRRPYLALVTVAGLLLAVGASAEAGGRAAVGGAGTAFTPPGFRPTNQGFINGNKSTAFEPYPSSTSKTLRPDGWDQGKGPSTNPWKGVSSPPGLNGH
jgi:hypothetical protein